MTASPIDTYRRQIERDLQAGNSTEHTHRPALKDLIESLAPGVTATNEPRRVEGEFTHSEHLAVLGKQKWPAT
jgi:hypothetical protein